MQQLKVVGRLYPAILDGSKTSTIRFNEQCIKPGALVYVCEGQLNQRVVVWVTKCNDMPLTDAARYLGKTREWPDDIMLDGMQEHYPEIQLSDIVQIVEHLSPRDSLAFLTKPLI
jgi:hypothetical protein